MRNRKDLLSPGVTKNNLIGCRSNHALRWGSGMIGLVVIFEVVVGVRHVIGEI